MDLRNELASYVPYNEQEERDRALLLWHLETAALAGEDAVERLYGRDDPAHMTASAWVVSPTRDRVLMAYHNIYRSWSWLGGHADGERDLRKVALREVCGESGIASVRLANPHIFSVEVLGVDGHEKRGRYVSSHLHLNVTFLVEADPDEPVRVKLDENSKVGWLSCQEALTLPTETWFVERVYRKLMGKTEADHCR